MTDWKKVAAETGAENYRLNIENTRLRTALAAAKIPHLIVEEDCWYSCLLAKHSDGEWAACYELRDGETRRCTCGADAHNARIDAALTATEGSTEERWVENAEAYLKERVEGRPTP